jgi:hypothetical protein
MATCCKLKGRWTIAKVNYEEATPNFTDPFPNRVACRLLGNN